MNLLFVCSENRLRSPTGEKVFSQYDGIKALGCGINLGANRRLNAELVEWADVIFVMEQQHERFVSDKFEKQLHDNALICLDIPDIYARMDPQLVKLLTEKVSQHVELP